MNLSTFNEATAPWQFKNMSGRARMALWFNIGHSLENDMSTKQSLQKALAVEEKSGQGKRPTAYALRAWIRSIDNGEKLAKAMESWVPADELMIIGAGQESSEIEKSFYNAAQLMEAKSTILMTIISAVAYPCIVLSLVPFALYTVGSEIVPNIVQNAGERDWHGKALVVITASQFVVNYWWIVVAALASFIAMVSYALPRFDGPIRVWLDKYPPFSLYRIFHGFSFIMALHSLIASNKPELPAMDQLSRTSIPWLRTRLVAAAAIMRSGKDMGFAFNEAGHNFPSIPVIINLSMYSQQSGLSKGLEATARTWMKTAVSDIKRIALGLTVVSFVLAAGTVAYIGAGLFEINNQTMSGVKSVIHR